MSGRLVVPWRTLMAAIAFAFLAIIPETLAAPPKVTALLVQQSGIARVVHGSDQKDHIEYDLSITNAFAAPVTLVSIEVLGPDGQVLHRLEGDALASLTKALMGGKPGPTVAASGVVDTVIDVIVPPGAAPRQLTHRIAYELPRPHPVASVIESEVIDGPSVTVDHREPLVIAPPLSGSGWYNANGCCNSGESAHRVARLPVNGSVFKHPETYAIDWLKEVNGRAFSGRGSALADHFAYGAVVKSATGGTVTSVRDGQPEQIPLEDARGINENIDYPGNFVIVRVAPDVYAFYAHFQPGSVAVKLGDQVTVGQRLGLLGNTGNSGIPHLHFGLMDGPNWASSDSLPFVFDRWDLAGMSPGDPFDAIHPEGPSGSRPNTYPLITSVANFGGEH
jgi:hypothetical protein